MDKVMYAFLAVVIVLGMWNTIAGSIFTIGGEYNYREGVSVWYRSFLAFQPDAALMAEAPIGFQLHALVAVRAVRAVAVHPAGARLQRAAGLPDPPLHRLPQPRRHRSSAATGRAVAGTGSAERRDDQMQNESLTALVRHHLAVASTASSGRSAHTVHGGHEHVLRQTLIALRPARRWASTRARARRRSRCCTAG